MDWQVSIATTMQEHRNRQTDGQTNLILTSLKPREQSNKLCGCLGKMRNCRKFVILKLILAFLYVENIFDMF